MPSACDRKVLLGWPHCFEFTAVRLSTLSTAALESNGIPASAKAVLKVPMSLNGGILLDATAFRLENVLQAKTEQFSTIALTVRNGSPCASSLQPSPLPDVPCPLQDMTQHGRTLTRFCLLLSRCCKLCVAAA